MIAKISPGRAIPGGEIEIFTEAFRLEPGDKLACYANGTSCNIVSASSRRVIAQMPSCDDSTVIIQLETPRGESNGQVIAMGKLLAEEMHIVGNPAIDPSDDALILTRSGSRGQQIANTLYRLETDGFLDELPVEVMNPTGIAFDPEGDMLVTNRADGSVYRIERGEEAFKVADELGIATGLAFDAEGIMYVGDRSGTVYRVTDNGRKEHFATIEPSVAAFHLAFGPDGRLFVSSPGFASHDRIYAIDADGDVENFVAGLGRPQGLAFDRGGNLYAAGCYRGRHGVVRIDPNSRKIEPFIAGPNVVGLCFTRNGEMVVATGDSVYSLNLGIYGTLLS